MAEKTKNKIIHVAEVMKKGGKSAYLLLRCVSPHRFIWFEESDDKEIETSVTGSNPQEAIKNARRYWREDFSFRTVLCGRRLTLPERDEHGDSALFHQMAASLETINGVYFDDELGHSCIVQNISQEGRKLYEKYRDGQRL